MTTLAQASAATPVKINTRVSDDLPDITDVRIPVVERSVALIDRLRRQELTPGQYMRAVQDMQEELDLPNSLGDWIDKAIAEKEDQVLYRRTGTAHREGLQLFYIDPNVFHPPHAHHNILSTQLILRGRAHLREYDRIARLDEDTLLMRLRTDGWAGPGAALRTTEIDANCHWFGAGNEPVVMLNFNAYGYQDWTFNPRDRPLRRNLVDPTYGKNPDGLVIAKEIGVEEAYAKFGGRPLSDFPV